MRDSVKITFHRGDHRGPQGVRAINSPMDRDLIFVSRGEIMNTFKDWAWLRVREGSTEDSWAQTCAGAGAVAWAAVAVLARAGMAPIGAIELIFLFGPLVIVPLGMELVRVMGASGRTELLARRIQPVAAGLAVISLWLPPGNAAGSLALAWMILCVLLGFSGVVDFASGVRSGGISTAGIPGSRNCGETRGTPISRSSLTIAALCLARLDLVVGGAWFVASRLGMRPMGIQEPIGLLTAVHFHFSGFATALIAAAALHFAGRRGKDQRLRWVVLAVTLMPYMVAVGFVVSSMLKMVTGVVFSVSVAVLAVFLRSSGKMAQNSAARILLQIAPGFVFAGMVLGAVYAIADFRGSAVLPIPQMARTHGVLNAVGFCMCGLLGWLVEFNSPTE
jgi:hypothetical protein